MMRSKREFCGVVIGVLLLHLTMAGCVPKKEDAVVAEKRVAVVLQPAEEREFREGFVVQGNLQAKDFALVGPLIPGTLEKIYVDEGDAVVAGKTVLFESDSLQVREAVQVSRQDLALAKGQQREAQANLDAQLAQFEKAEIDYERFLRLREKDAVTKDAMEQQTMRYKAMKAGLDHAHTVVDLAAEQTKKAQAGLAIAEKNLKDSKVIAPLSGVVSYKMTEQGEFGAVGHPVVRIENTDVLEMSAFVPGEYYPRIVPGETKVRISANGIDAGEFVVAYKSPTIQPQLRTFEMKCVLENPKEGIVAGAMAEVDILLQKRVGLGVPVASVQTRSSKTVVFLVENEKARMAPVETGLQSDGWVELISPSFAPGTPVVRLGQYMLDEGDLVDVQKGDV